MRWPDLTGDRERCEGVSSRCYGCNERQRILVLAFQPSPFTILVEPTQEGHAVPVAHPQGPAAIGATDLCVQAHSPIQSGSQVSEEGGVGVGKVGVAVGWVAGDNR